MHDEVVVRNVSCAGCGATMAYSARDLALRCPYCDSVMVIEAPASAFRPERIIPFAVERERALAAYRKWLAGGWFRPADFSATSRLDELKGVYVPLWSYDVDADSNWTASAGYRQTGKPADDAHTRWEPASGTHRGRYQHVLALATKGLDRTLFDRLRSSFDLGGLQPYDADYVAGWVAESAAGSADAMWAEAEKEVRSEEREACGSLVPGDRHKQLKVTSRLERTGQRLILLPIWTFALTYGGKRFAVGVNGQSGKCAGAAPSSPVKIALAISIAVAVIGLVVFLLAR